MLKLMYFDIFQLKLNILVVRFFAFPAAQCDIYSSVYITKGSITKANTQSNHSRQVSTLICHWSLSRHTYKSTLCDYKKSILFWIVVTIDWIVSSITGHMTFICRPTTLFKHN